MKKDSQKFSFWVLFLLERNLPLHPPLKRPFRIEFFRLNEKDVNTLSFRTNSAKKEEVERKWYVVDAEGKTAGRLFSSIAAVLMGKHKPAFTSHVDTGDFVIVVNADKIRFTGSKLDDKEYIRYTGYPGGQRRETARNLQNRKPEAIIEIGVKGMLPKTKLGRAMVKKLFVYAGAEHPHQAQKPEPFNF
jgi:large subunit ribosomal protein L13